MTRVEVSPIISSAQMTLRFIQGEGGPSPAEVPPPDSDINAAFSGFLDTDDLLVVVGENTAERLAMGVRGTRRVVVAGRVVGSWVPAQSGRKALMLQSFDGGGQPIYLHLPASWHKDAIAPGAVLVIPIQPGQGGGTLGRTNVIVERQHVFWTVDARPLFGWVVLEADWQRCSEGIRLGGDPWGACHREMLWACAGYTRLLTSYSTNRTESDKGRLVGPAVHRANVQRSPAQPSLSGGAGVGSDGPLSSVMESATTALQWRSSPSAATTAQTSSPSLVSRVCPGVSSARH